MIAALLVFLVVIACTALVTALAERTIKSRQELIETINDQLPQTQCGKCGYTGCRPYAAAIVENEAGINQCPPGGKDTIKSLAKLTGQRETGLNPLHGSEQPRQLAVIDEALCIGCVKCIRACPVDAIVGAPGLMHTVIDRECTGCELCLEPCPVDCISMEPDTAIGQNPAAKTAPPAPVLS